MKLGKYQIVALVVLVVLTLVLVWMLRQEAVQLVAPN